jgi:hypothetical protein
MNLFEQQAKAIQSVRNMNNVVQFPTHEQVLELKASGKHVFHRHDAHAQRNAEQASLLQEAIDNPPPEAA